jgi:hypothetical protein
MSRPEGFVGTLSITWDDGEKNVYQIAQAQGHIWVGEHFVSVRNEKSMEGVLREISEIMSFPPRKIRQHTWLELVNPIKFYKF